jgi:TolA-binding protein
VRETADRCPEGLFARSRLGPLSPVERRALDAHLGVCELCRAAMLFATLYDDLPDETDETAQAYAVRIANRLVTKRMRRPRAARFMALAVAAVVLAVAGVATAWMLARRPRRSVQNEPPVASTPRRGTDSHGIVALGAPSPDSGAMTATATPPPPAPLPAVAPPPRMTAPPSVRAPRGRPAPPLAALAPVPVAPDMAPAEDPASLFAAANAARLAEEFPEAVEGYHQLQNRFPASDEARLSFFSTADVLQRLGEPARALAELDRYLEAQPSGALASEALFGRARCLDALGRRTEAVEAWERLLRDFPDSIYEAAARRRLAELAR